MALIELFLVFLKIITKATAPIMEVTTPMDSSIGLRRVRAVRSASRRKMAPEKSDAGRLNAPAPEAEAPQPKKRGRKPKSAAPEQEAHEQD